jgi:hypothetical protein
MAEQILPREGHTLICGVTMSGKTTCAHKLAQFDEADRIPVIVFDPVMTETAAGEWPDHAQIYTDSEKFLQRMGKMRGEPVSVYIDEGGDIFSHAQADNRWILTRGRHLGYSVTLICQRPKLVHPSVRHQTSRLFLFRLAHTDLQAIGADYGFTGLGQVKLDQGDFVVLYSGHAQILKGNIFAPEILNAQKGSPTWNSILNPPLSPSSLSPSSGGSTHSGQRSPGAADRAKLSTRARAPKPPTVN